MGSGRAMASGGISELQLVIKKKPSHAPVAKGKSDERALLEFFGMGSGRVFGLLGVRTKA